MKHRISVRRAIKESEYPHLIFSERQRRSRRLQVGGWEDGGWRLEDGGRFSGRRGKRGYRPNLCPTRMPPLYADAGRMAARYMFHQLCLCFSKPRVVRLTFKIQICSSCFIVRRSSLFPESRFTKMCKYLTNNKFYSYIYQ